MHITAVFFRETSENLLEETNRGFGNLYLRPGFGWKKGKKNNLIYSFSPVAVRL